MCVLFNTKGGPRLVIFVGADRHTNLFVSSRNLPFLIPRNKERQGGRAYPNLFLAQ